MAEGALGGANCVWSRQVSWEEGGILDQRKLACFIISHNLGEIVALNEKGKQPVIKIGVYGNKSTTNADNCLTTQWKSGKKQPRPLRDASNKFREGLKNFKLEKDKLVLVHTHTATLAKTGVPVEKTVLPPSQPSKLKRMPTHKWT
jgi:hypothetical protein